MISIDKLVDQERAVLDYYAKSHSGSELATFVAKRTKKYLIQEILRALDKVNDIDHARSVVRSFGEL